MQHKALLAALDGLLCVYKPADLSISGLKRMILKKICTEGNDAITHIKPPMIKVPLVEAHPETGALLITGEREQMDYMCHPLVSGEVFRKEDLRIEELMESEAASSGVCLFGINNFCDELPRLMSNSWLNSYRIEGMLGRETVEHEIKGRVSVKCEYDHITKHKMSKLLARIQSQYHRMSFETANVDLQSQKAFELARKGLPRAQLPGTSLIYSLELSSFNPPYFTLHLQVVGESDKFLRYFVHELGVTLGSTACPIRLQRRSIGPFYADHALLDKQLSLQNILRNVSFCRKLLNTTVYDPNIISRLPQEDHRPTELVDGLGLQEADEEDAMRPAWPRNYS